FIKIFSDAVQSYIVHQELEFAKIATRPMRTIIDKQVKQIDWLYAHKFWLFSLAGGMDATLEVTKQSAKNWMKLPKKYDQETKDTQVSNS
ncbi:MAG: motility accessory factor, partial [Helicobacter sp.]|nr:motility accessory factor [Helicobacter sp.]